MGTNLSIALWLLHALVADLVVIEPEGADPALTRVIVDSYRDAVGEVDVQQDGSETHWYARVTWDEAKLHARVEIRRGSPSAAIEAQRDVEFSETDDLEQRHRAVGLIVAAHVLAREREREEEAAKAKVAAGGRGAGDGDGDGDRGRDRDRDRDGDGDGDDHDHDHEDEDEDEDEGVVAARMLPMLGIDVAVLGGPMLDRGAAGFGVMLRGFASAAALPVVAVIGSLRVAHRFEAPEITTGSGTLGLVLRLQPRGSMFSLEVRGEGVLQQTRVQADGGTGNSSDTGSAWRGGGQLGLEGHASVSQSVSLFGGGELRLLRPAVHLEVEGREIGVERALGWNVLCGVRYAR